MSGIEFREVAAADPSAEAFNGALTDEVNRRQGTGHGPTAPLRELDPPLDAVLVAYRDGVPAGLGTLRRLGPTTAEIKRMIVAGEHRGHGIGRRLLEELERRARALGCGTVRLDSAGGLTEAIELYRSAGYEEIPRYNDNPQAQLWFEKELASASWRAR